ncbi:putative oxygenase MesX, partial [Serratia marcescens]|uniref:putative oxygenase MesX n=1 Tax=Serratia marcescens TaxID=615 RepID=UPI0011E7F8FF
KRQENLRNTLVMINNRFNSLAHWDNPKSDRYAVELEIISAQLNIRLNDKSDTFPVIEVLNTRIVDKKNHEVIDGIVGNNFSSYVRDYDFSVLLPAHNHKTSAFSLPDDFGTLHGNLFKCFVNSAAYKDNFAKAPVICLSVSSKNTYYRTGNTHPVLGAEYQQDEPSLTDRYFAKMGLRARYFMPANSVAPLAFYFTGDLLSDYTDLELIGTISTMETFQKIYRPE